MVDEKLYSYTLFFKVFGIAKDTETGEDCFAGIKLSIQTTEPNNEEQIKNAFNKCKFAKTLNINENNIYFISKDEYENNYSD